jgi:hypothetical protein
MANQPYLVVRLLPEEPIDGATFTTYLDGLQLQVFDAYSAQPLSDIVYASPLSFFQWPLGFSDSSDPFFASGSTVTNQGTPYNGSNYGNVLYFNSTAGMSVGSYVFTTDGTSSTGPTIDPSSSYRVTAVTETTATLNNTLGTYVPAGTVVSFIGKAFTDNASNPSGAAGEFVLPTSGVAQTGNAAAPSQSNPLVVLPFASTAGVAVGMLVTGTDVAAGATVAEVRPASVTLSASLTAAPPVGTEISFTMNAPFASLTLVPTNSGAGSDALTFSSTAGIAFGMTLNPINDYIAPGTTVVSANGTTVLLSLPLVAALPVSQSVTFTFPLSSGIVQHLTELVSISFLDISVVAVPTAVATAVIPLNLPSPPPDYLNLTVAANRPNDTIPISTIFYNVLVQTSQSPDPGIYQLIPDNETSFYLTLPPQPRTTPIALEIPADGSAPPFDALYQAVASALSFDPISDLTPVSQVASTTLHTSAATTTGSTLTFSATPGLVVGMFVSGNNIAQGSVVTNVVVPLVTLSKPLLGTIASGEAITFTPAAALVAALGASTENCTRVAYDIVWSYLTPLPIPPDPLESLYTNPPNPGSSTQDSNSGDAVLEQDRQKFQGTLNSFYSTRNATAERLAKFVAAISAAVFCEVSSVNASAALLEFPVDSSQTFATAVESEILLKGIGGSAADAINFGVPAAFFFALGAKMDKSTTAVQRYLMATGDAIDRLLQEFDAAEDAGVIEDSEAFADPALGGTAITAFQAARRLVALGVSAASGSPAVTLSPTAAAGTPGAALAALVRAWLAATDPNGTAPPANPPPSYDEKDFLIWQQLAATGLGPAGYVALDVYALTQAYAIPAVGPLTDQILSATQTFDWPTTGATVAALKQVSNLEWTTFFTANPTWLPPFTQPVVPAASQPASTPTIGYTNTRIRAFIRAVQKFFTTSSVATSSQPWTPGTVPRFALPAYDPIGLAVSNLPAGFTFGTPISAADLATAVAAVFPGDASAQAWLAERITTVNELIDIAKVVPNPTITNYTLPNPVNLSVSVAEALYARGFRNAADITKLSAAEFQQALTGTVAFDFATDTAGTSLWQAAQLLAPMSVPADTVGGQTFKPINPDGMLVNCVPPPCLSPIGPAAYLAELLKISESSTCEDAFPPPPPSRSDAEKDAIQTHAELLWEQAGRPTEHALDFWLHAEAALQSQGDIPVFPPATLGSMLAQRRGPLGTLLATCANVETPLPLVDIVNECLEFLGATVTNTAGTVYDTSADALAGFKLCQKTDCPEDADPACYEPEGLFAAIPEYSTPGTPTVANQAVEPAVYDCLKADFSSCNLPYSKALDVSRSYLRYFGGSRFDTLRRFRKCITEFALDPVNPPTEFQSYLWRYPVRIETAIEYLGITPEEYASLFQGTPPRPCSSGDRDTRAAAAVVSGWELYGFPSARTEDWASQASVLSQFLRRTCLSYCEFLELWQAVQEPASKDAQLARTSFPACEPCCLDDYRLQIPEGEAGERVLVNLAIFIRLWRKLRTLCGAEYSFAQLWDICNVLELAQGSVINPDFVRQLAAFQMLRDVFELPLRDRADTTVGATGADRTHILALWVGNGAKHWNWAVARLLDGVAGYARAHFGRGPGGSEMGQLAGKLDALSRLAGFDPPTAANPSADGWNSDPACTLRFAEVLAKILGSEFKPGELLYLFNAETGEPSEHWFAECEPDEADAFPLDLPGHDDRHSLWELRRALLHAEVYDDAIHAWTWPRVIRDLRAHFGYAPPAGEELLLSLGQHFFPCMLEAAGFTVTPPQRQYHIALTSTTGWNTPSSPFTYDATAGQLSLHLPLRDEQVAAKLGQLPELTAAEQAAVQDLYFAPRVDLAHLAFLFPDWQDAELHLIQESDEGRRWWYFRRHLALADARRKMIVAHLAGHVAHRAGGHMDDLKEVAGLVLGHMSSDENTGTPWESDSGVPPTVLWAPPSGGAVAALLGLVGTGLRGDYEIAGAPVSPAGANAVGGSTSWQLAWRDVRGPMQAFGHERDHTNSPVPTVIPALSMSVSSLPIIVQNGYASLSDGRRLGGMEGFRVRWSGMLLIDHEGHYAFHAGAPTPECEAPDFERAENSQWRVTLQRGPRRLLVLNHQWPGEAEQEHHEPRLRRGAYRITVEFAQPTPALTGSHPRPSETSFQLKYAGPDSEGRKITVPVTTLYRDVQDETLDSGITFLPGTTNPQAFLKGYYTSTLRDIRRTYQRAFKAVLFCGGLKLSARPSAEGGQSELGYMLANPTRFAGYAYYRTSPTSFATHLANLDFDFLPITDSFQPQVLPAPSRSAPSLQRSQAMFDWWERLFDYGQLRKAAAQRGVHHVWLLFRDALAQSSGSAAPLLRLINVDAETAPLALRYYQDQYAPIYNVSANDLADERWLLRIWQADSWLRGFTKSFHPHFLGAARPDLWVAMDPSAPMPASGVTETGNANLVALLNRVCVATGEPRRLRDVKQVNDGLRDRGRAALIAYLCAMNRVALPFTPGAYATAAQDLGDLLLLDVQAGLCERASRIEEAITAVQSFVRRARLTLEPGWTVSRAFVRLWDARFASYRVWERAKRKDVYRENWIEWEELGKARHIEAFRFLETELRQSTLTLAAPGGMDWWLDDDKALECAPTLIQRRDPSDLQPLVPPPQSVTREGLGTIGNPEHTGDPAWLAPVPAPAAAVSTPSPPPIRVSPTQAAQAAATGTTHPLPLWMEAATKLGTRFVRIAAAGVPQAALAFSPRHDSHGGCCDDCGEDHPIVMDEYYFWLVAAQVYTYTEKTDAQNLNDTSFNGSYQFGFQDSFYDQIEQQSADWNNEDQVPQLVAKWQPDPAVRLAWCRVHNGQFGQPRKSDVCLQVTQPLDTSPTGPDLVFLGRGEDSLFFSVTNAPATPPGYTDKSPPGFRYDLRSDSAVSLPEVLPAPPAAVTLPGGLISYPFYAYHDPGAPLFPRTWFAPALAVAGALRTRCAFELALKWYARAFDPLRRDCTWMECGEQAIALDGGACCDSADVTEAVARDRTLTLHFCQTLMEWGDSMMRHRRAPEAFQQARLLFDTVGRIMGPRPRTVLMKEPGTSQPIASFTPAFAPLNPRLLDLYAQVAERRGMVHACIDARRLTDGVPDRDLAYFGDDPLREGWRNTETCADEMDWCVPASPYRFTFLIEKAKDLAGRVRELGGALLAAYEKGDAEYLASLRAGQERELLSLGLSIRQDQWRDADWQVQALQQTKDVSQTNLIYYTGLYQNGLLNDETQNISLATNAMQMRTSANITEAFGEAMKVIPDIFVGFCSSDTQVPVGTKLAGVFETIAKVMTTVADVQSETAAIDLTQAGWQRRSIEWFHQTLVLPIEIQQVELQILGAQRRRDQAIQELNNQQRQIENATEVLDFLRDKFTATDLYLWLQKETAALYRQIYELADRVAMQAQRAYNLERGHTARRFIPDSAWDDLHDGLLAGERLEASLHQMEVAYLDKNVREYELTKHFSLRLQFPMQFLRLRTTGRCEIDIPEWMFDQDYPGHFMRRIRNVTLTIPCVTGPYTGVHCRLTLLSSVTRIDPRLAAPVHGCCCTTTHCGCDDKDGSGSYLLCPDDPRMVKIYGARDAIATSGGQNDSGLFELSFNDPRYLPFEFMGAVSRWRIELPPENNYFDPNTLTDTVLHVNYTAREGGELLRRAAAEAARGKLPGDGWSFFDLRHDFPDGWELFHRPAAREADKRDLSLHLRRSYFPYLPGNPELRITRFMLLFETADMPERAPTTTEDCCCPQPEAFGAHVVIFRDCLDRSREHGRANTLICRAAAEWPRLYSGMAEVDMMPFGKPSERNEVVLEFPDDIGDITHAYLYARYEPVQNCRPAAPDRSPSRGRL